MQIIRILGRMEDVLSPGENGLAWHSRQTEVRPPRSEPGDGETAPRRHCLWIQLCLKPPQVSVMQGNKFPLQLKSPGGGALDQSSRWS